MDEIIIPITLELSFRMKDQPIYSGPEPSIEYKPTSLLGKALKSGKRKTASKRKTKMRADKGKTREQIQTELEDLKDYISKHRGRMSLSDIAKELGVSYHRVYHARRTIK